MKEKYFKIVKAGADRGEIHIYGDIVSEDWRWDDDDTSAVSFRDSLKALEGVQVIELRINSGGGDVFEAAAIYNMLKRHKARVEVHIDGLAASAASVIAMAGDKITMPQNSMMMIHNAWGFAMGNHNDFRKQADDLEKINNSTVKQAYLSKNTGMDADELTRLMDEETWLTAAEALEMGLADEVVESVQVAASISDDQLARYKNVPSALKDEEEQNQDDERIKSLEAKVAALTAQLNPQQEPKEPEQKPINGLQRFFLNL